MIIKHTIWTRVLMKRNCITPNEGLRIKKILEMESAKETSTTNTSIHRTPSRLLFLAVACE
jgi:hypothetical protein